MATRYPNATHYSKHFTRAELDCKCPRHTVTGRKRHPLWVRRRLRKLARNLERMRRAHGGPIAVGSGYRCPAHNADVKGASRSQHMLANAADILVPGTGKTKIANQKKLLGAALRVWAFRHGGIGTYPSGAFHVDQRGLFARWTSY